jgi:hypothetical protein
MAKRYIADILFLGSEIEMRKTAAFTFCSPFRSEYSFPQPSANQAGYVNSQTLKNPVKAKDPRPTAGD